MSQQSVEREIATKRAYADSLERRANDPAHAFSSPEHRAHLLHEAARVRADADREAAHLASHRRPHPA